MPSSNNAERESRRAASLKTFGVLVLRISVLMMTLSCVHSARVFEKRPQAGDPYATQKLKGIPFYGKKLAYKQTSAWEKSWYEVTLQVAELEGEKPKGEPAVFQKWVPFSSCCEQQDGNAECDPAETTAGSCPTRPSLDRLKDKVAGKGPRTKEQKEEIVKDFKGLPTIGGEDEVQELLVSNYVEPILVVDYTREMYLNAWLPWFGSSTLTSKLASDGTLTEATVTTESKIPEAISTLIPLKEFLTAETISATAVAQMEGRMRGIMDQIPAAVSRVPPKFKITLQVAVKGYLYAFLATYPTDPRTSDETCPQIPSPCEWPGCIAPLRKTQSSGVSAAAPWGSSIEAIKNQLPGVTTIAGACRLIPLPFNKASGSFKRTALESKPKPKKPAKKISISGDIILPEEKKKE